MPRTIQTTVLVSHRRGGTRLMEPKEITRPRGTAPTSVTKKSWRVLMKPVFRADRTVRNSVEPKKESIRSSSHFIGNFGEETAAKAESELSAFVGIQRGITPESETPARRKWCRSPERSRRQWQRSRTRSTRPPDRSPCGSPRRTPRTLGPERCSGSSYT